MLLAVWTRPRAGWTRPRVQVPVTKTYRSWTRGRVGWARPRVWQKSAEFKQTAGLGGGHGGVSAGHDPV